MTSAVRFRFTDLVRGVPRVVRAAVAAQAAVLVLGVFGWPLHQAPDEPWHVDLTIAVADGRAFLLSLVSGHWAVEAIYD